MILVSLIVIDFCFFVTCWWISSCYVFLALPAVVMFLDMNPFDMKVGTASTSTISIIANLEQPETWSKRQYATIDMPEAPKQAIATASAQARKSEGDKYSGHDKDSKDRKQQELTCDH